MHTHHTTTNTHSTFGYYCCTVHKLLLLLLLLLPLLLLLLPLLLLLLLLLLYSMFLLKCKLQVVEQNSNFIVIRALELSHQILLWVVSYSEVFWSDEPCILVRSFEHLHCMCMCIVL
jgi:endonuclease/exonuclease/phosphatase (EEP) superfamily protein YafD